MRAVFPRYYLVGLISGGTALAAALALDLDMRVTAPLLASLVLAAYARQVITPAVNTARDSRDDTRFARLHGLSVRLNLIVLALLLLVGTVVAGIVR
jgi:hypothetical protein